MKRRTLIKQLTKHGAEFVREGLKHTVYRNPRTGILIAVPRHREIGATLAEKLCRLAQT